MRVHFGALVIDSDTRELRLGDAPVPLSPKAFDLLALLVAHRPKALAKSDLLDRLWPSTFVVEKNLVNLISEIRDAIGDDPASPQFIRTVHRFGYAFRETFPPSGERERPSTPGGAACFQVKWANGGLILEDGEHVIGRDPDVEILLASPGVSRRHALIRISGGTATIDDLGSKNGTFVGKQRVEGPKSLAEGDVIGVGPVKLTVKVLRPANSTETQRMDGLPE
jgi:DNA-binding winged helix-turn-helix (wHTH) protein